MNNHLAPDIPIQEFLENNRSISLNAEHVQGAEATKIHYINQARRVLVSFLDEMPRRKIVKVKDQPDDPSDPLGLRADMRGEPKMGEITFVDPDKTDYTSYVMPRPGCYPDEALNRAFETWLNAAKV